MREALAELHTAIAEVPLAQILAAHESVYFLLGIEAAEAIETYRHRRELLRQLDRAIKELRRARRCQGLCYKCRDSIDAVLKRITEESK